MNERMAMTRVAERKRRAVVRTREDILEAAARAFARTGYRSVSMRDIAREAGYTAAALYTYFENKQEILEGLVTMVIEDMLRVFDEPVPAGLTFPQRLRLLLGRFLAEAERRRDLFALFLALAQAHVHPRPHKGHDPIKVMQKSLERLALWFHENASPAERGGHSPEVLARFFSGVTHSFLSEWMMRGAPPGELGRREALMLDLFLYGVSGGRAGRKRPAMMQ
jgi:AcrR family transcriptional regulator